MSSNKQVQANTIVSGTISTGHWISAGSGIGADLGDWLRLGDVRINTEQLKEIVDLLEFVKSPAAGDLYYSFQLFQAEKKLKDE